MPYKLAHCLLERNITMVGTDRKNKPKLQPSLRCSQGREGGLVFSHSTPWSYLAKKNKNVLLMSMRHIEPEVSDQRDRKPTVVLDYNHNKGGVDNLDK